MSTNTTLVSILRFKNLNAQLTEQEFDTFLSKTSRIIGREKMLSMLCRSIFNPLRSAPAPHRDEADVQTCNDVVEMTLITTDILQERESMSSSSHEPRLNGMPTNLIGEIASFLKQKEYAHFSLTNRKIFVHCYSPCKLQQLMLDKRMGTNFFNISFRKFSQIKHLEFELRQISQFNTANGAIFSDCRQVVTLHIIGFRATSAELDMLLNKSSPCFAQVRCLTLEEFDVDVNLNQLVQLLSKFESLVHLRLEMMHMPGRLALQSLSSVCPKIKEFVSVGDHRTINESMLHSWKFKIDSLFLHEYSGIISDSDFSSIKRLGIQGMSASECLLLFHKSEKLEEITWIPPYSRFGLTGLQLQHEELPMKCIEQQPQLKYLYISTGKYFEAICNGIYRGLYSTKKRKRKQFEVTLYVDADQIGEESEQDFVCCIAKIIHAITKSNIEEWMICVDANKGEIYEGFRWEPMKRALDDLLKSLAVAVECLKATEYGFILGNDCGMRRHCLWWQKGGSFSEF